MRRIGIFRLLAYITAITMLAALALPARTRAQELKQEPPRPELLSIAVTPADAAIFPHRMEQFTATGTYSDGRTHDLTRRVTWSSSALDVATISREGLASAIGAGQTTIEAALGAINGSTTFNVASFILTGSMNGPRTSHTGTLLNNGMVLLAGGVDSSGSALAIAELYNPATETFSYTGSMNTARYDHTATLLNDGRVLLAGGTSNGSTVIGSAELYNPATETFSYTGSMNTPRDSHAATLLNNGMVLMAAGETEAFLGATSAELYDPATETFSYTGSLSTPRQWPSGTLLEDGAVLIAGGQTGDFLDVTASAELYNPSTGTFSYTGSMNTVRVEFTATRLNKGLTLMAGGQTGTTAYLAPSGSILSSAELYGPITLTPPDLESIAITPERSTLSPGETQHFIATGTFRDGSRQRLASVTWNSSDPTVAQISNDASNHGVALAIDAGTTFIEARAGRVRGWARLTVQQK